MVPTVLSSSFLGLNSSQSGGYAPTDSQGAVGPSSYLESVNLNLSIYDKMTGNPTTSMDIGDFFGKTNSGLAPFSTTDPKAQSAVQFSDPVVAYDNLAGRFIIGVQSVSDPDNAGGDGEGVFDIAVSTSNNPSDFTNTNWHFFQISTTEKDPNYNSQDPASSHQYYYSDYPGNLGYNEDALVFTMNEMSQNGRDSQALVTAVNMNDLTAVVQPANPHFNQFFDPKSNVWNIRPTAMQDSKAGDPMWLVTEDGNTANTIDVYEMTNPLSATTLGTMTSLTVNSYSKAVPLVQPDGTKIASNIDSRILQAAEAGKILVAAQTVAPSASSPEDDARWYEINVSSGTPVLQDQGDVPGGNNSNNYNSYAAYPGIDINSQGDIGMTFLATGTAPQQFLSMYVTGRTPVDPKGTMETPVIVQAGSQLFNDPRAGDLSGINVDADGSFWAVNEFANSDSTRNWGTAVSHFTVGQAADVSVVVDGPPTVTAGATATYTITVTNNGPNDTDSFTITDTSSSLVSLLSATADNSSNPSNFDINLNKTKNTATITLHSGAILKAAESDVFKVVVQIPHTFATGSYITNTATITSTSTTVPDPNLFNDTSTAQSSVTTSADMEILSASGPSTITAGTDATYTVTIKNDGPSDAQNVKVSDILPVGLIFQLTPAQAQAGNNPDGFTLQGNDLVATTVAAGSTDVLQFFAHAPSDLLPNGKLLSDTINVTTDTTDPSIPDNIQVSSTLTTSADLAVTVSPPPPVVEGNTITYNVSVTNNGPSDAQNVVLSDMLSPDMTLVSANFGAATVSSSGNTITVALSTLAANNTATGTIIVQTTEDGDLTNAATVSSATSDPVPSNNTVPVTTAVSEDAINLTGGVSLNTTEFAALNDMTLATFSHAQAVEPTSAFTALVSWGDGSTSTANVVLSGTTYSVVASHTYNVTGNYTILVTVSEDGASASATDGASVQEAPLPAGLPQSIAASPDFETIEDNLSQPLSLGQALSVEMSLPSLLLQTAQSLIQQGQTPFLALPDILAAVVVERIDDIFHEPISAPQLQSVDQGLLGLFIQIDQSMMQQGQDPGQALLSSFYLSQAECNLFATVLMDNGVSLDTAASQMLPSLLLQIEDMLDGST